MKESQKQHQQNIEQMYADLWEQDIQAKKQREEAEANEQQERNREMLRVSRSQPTTPYICIPRRERK